MTAFRSLALAAVVAMVACVGLKEDEPGAMTDGPGSAVDAASDPGRASDGERPEGGAADGGPSIASVPDRRSPGELTTTPDDVVLDPRTGLRWKLARSPQPLEFVAATKLCAAARTEGAADWRLPTKIELLSLADYGQTELTSLPAPFAHDVLDFWSSDEVVRVVPVHPIWFVGFVGPGTATRDPVPDVSTLARCVRGAKLGRAALVTEGNLVRDTRSGLSWERARSPDAMKVAAAASRCAALTIDGKTGFRLPQVKELLSLLDDAQPAAPFEDPMLPSPRGGLLMTATVVRNETAVVAVDFDTGRLFRVNATGFVRCVR